MTIKDLEAQHEALRVAVERVGLWSGCDLEQRGRHVDALRALDRRVRDELLEARLAGETQVLA